MLADYQQRLVALKEDLETYQAGSVNDAIEAVEAAIVAVQNLAEDNKTLTGRARIAYGYKGGMTAGGEETDQINVQLRDLLSNQNAMLASVKAGLERVSPLVGAQIDIATRTIDVLGG